MARKIYKPDKKRKLGFYWVKFKDEIWQPAYFSGLSGWSIAGDEEYYFDDDFEKIDELILKQNKKI